LPRSDPRSRAAADQAQASGHGRQVTARDADLRFMREALALADNALYTATPNPRVGCVIVKDSTVIGRGWTQAYGGLHAEQHALANCPADPSGSTVYVTFEPCNRVGASGRTESCVASLLRAKPARVVVATIDPNPQMARHWLAMLGA